MPAEVKPSPEYLARKDEGVMSKEDLQSVVRTALTRCVRFVDDELSVERAEATKYYLGKPFGNEEVGRSQVVLTEVRDAVDGMVPSLMRVFFGPEHTVEFVPNRADTVQRAEQQTDYVRYVFEEDNAGFLHTMGVIKDGLVRKIGIFKWWWDASTDTEAFKQEGIDPAALQLLAGDDDVELTSATQREDGTFDVEFTRTTKGGRPRVCSVPPEEFLYNRSARSLDEAKIVAHRTYKTRGELLAMGVKKKVIDEHAGTNNDTTLSSNAEELARRDTGRVGTTSSVGLTADPELGDANDNILYTEAFVTVDFDGDGIAELRRICAIGDQYYPVANDPAPERPFSIFTPYPEPHTLLGGSVADRTMDVQKITSSILRGTLDSASLAMFPRMAYLDGQVNVGDLMNTEIGAPIRERVTGAVRPIEVTFTGREMLPVLTFMQEVIERRTGRNKGAAGLDADALQSTGKEAVGAVLTGSQEQIEVIARVFAEMTLKPLMRGLGRMLAAHQPRTRMVRLRGTWIDVDPRTWTDTMDVTVSVGLGAMFTEKKIATLMSVAADQKDILTTMGLQNPLVTLPMVRNTRAKILALQGLRDADSYYSPLPADWQPPAPSAPPPDPEQLWIQAEKEMNHQKTMKELAIKSDELALEREKAQWDHEFQMQKLAADVQTKKYVADASNAITASANELTARIEEEAREAELTMDGHQMLHDQHLSRAQHEHDKAMGIRAADTADAQAVEPTGEA